MAYREMVDVLYRDNSKFEIWREYKAITIDKFYIYKDGEFHRGPLNSLEDAVAAVEEETS